MTAAQTARIRALSRAERAAVRRYGAAVVAALAEPTDARRRAERRAERALESARFALASEVAIAFGTDDEAQS